MTDTSCAVVITGAAGNLGRALGDSVLADGLLPMPRIARRHRCDPALKR